MITLSLPWLRGRRLPPAQQRRARLRHVLTAAVKQTRYARDYDLRALAAAGDPLRSFPRVDLLEFLCHPERYTVPKGCVERERLLYPLGTPPRTAVVGRAVEERWKVKCFGNLRSEALQEFAPQSLAAPLDVLRADTAERVLRTPLRNALIVFTGILQGPLTAPDSDLLWRRFQVPVFEQFLGFDGELLAWECEIHHGLHVREEAAQFGVDEEENVEVSFLANPRLPVVRLVTGLAGRLLYDACPCGDAAPRLVDLRRRAVKRAASEKRLAVAQVG